MAIPDFQTVMLPLLQCLSDREEHVKRALVDRLADHFKLSDEERNTLLPSGKQATFDNRIAWALTHMGKAGLVQAPRRSHYQLTDRGAQILSRGGSRVDMKVLGEFPEYVAFRAPKTPSGASTPAPVAISANSEDDISPTESIELSYQRLRDELARELLQQIMACSPAFFERLVVDLLLRMGYGGTRRDAGEAIGRSGDGGIDGIIKEDRLGLDVVYIQAKRWDGVVGRPEIQKFAGALQGQRARKGIFITTSGFTKEAVQFGAMIDTKIVLIDGENLAQLMIDHNVGVAAVVSYELKRVDSDYFEGV
jgi:restriction system protein